VGLWHQVGGGHYPAIAYQVAFGILVALQVPGLLLFAWRRRAVKCELPIITPKEKYEIGPLRSPR
jgi:hypothetical protein